MKPLPENATEKMKFIYQRQVMDARWRAASEFDEMMTKRHEAELKVIPQFKNESLNNVETHYISHKNAVAKDNFP